MTTLYSHAGTGAGTYSSSDEDMKRLLSVGQMWVINISLSLLSVLQSLLDLITTWSSPAARMYAATDF